MKNDEESLRVAQNRLLEDISYSFRRYFVDVFFIKNIDLFVRAKTIADLGGKRIKKRGVFDIEKFTSNTSYFNLDKSTNPDFLCDLERIPVPNDSYECAILAEVLEHVESPENIIKEAHRLLSRNGHLLITVPFQFRVHKDPKDYYRFTDIWFKETLERLGFEIITIEAQGFFYSLISNLLKTFLHDYLQNRGKTLKTWFLKKNVRLILKQIYKLSLRDNSPHHSDFIKSNTTGFGIVARKL